MSDPNQQREEHGRAALEVVGDVAEVGVDIATEGVIDMTLDGVSAAAEIAVDIVGGVLSSVD